MTIAFIPYLAIPSLSREPRLSGSDIVPPRRNFEGSTILFLRLLLRNSPGPE